MNSTAAPSRRSRVQFWLMAVVFGGPLIVAYLVYYKFPELAPTGRTNYGQLVDPTRPWPQLQFVDADGKTLASASLGGKWSLVYLGSADCGDGCRQRLILARQVRLALNEKRERVQRIYLAPNASALSQVQAPLAAEHPDLIWLAASADAEGPLRQFFQPSDPEALYLLDPLGNWVIVYPRAADPEALQHDFKGMQKDIKKLLKLTAG
jgi:hypothetical protein